MMKTAPDEGRRAVCDRVSGRRGVAVVAVAKVSYTVSLSQPTASNVVVELSDVF